MKTDMKMIYKFKLAVLFTFLSFTLFAKGLKPAHEKSKTITEEFDVSSTSDVSFSHQRGILKVKYIDSDKGRIEAIVRVAGDDENDLQYLLDALSIDIDQMGNKVNIKIGNEIKSWSSNTVFFYTKHNIELKDGKRITTKVDQISIAATLFLPKVSKLMLSTRYDDIDIQSCQADNLKIDIHSGTLYANDLNMETKVNIKYGKLDLKQIADFTLESHDSKGTLGNLNRFVLNDKYSDFRVGNVLSLDATLHDSDLEMGNVCEDANIYDKYSVISLGNIQNGKWNLHDSKVKIGNSENLNIQSKYTDFVIDDASKLDIRSHDDNFRLKKVKELTIIDSKYSQYEIGTLENEIHASASHDDDYEVDVVSTTISNIDLKGKYSKFDIPLPPGIGYSLEAKTKYGTVTYPKEGLKETKHIAKDSELEIIAIPADGSSKLNIKVAGHDCRFEFK